MQTKKYIIQYITLLLTLFTFEAQAAGPDLKWSEVRFFISDNYYAKEQTELDSLTAVDNIEKLKKFTGFGIEIDAQYKSWVKLGSRFRFIGNSIYPVGSTSSSTSYLQLIQYTAGIVARVPIAENKNVSFDILAELGLSNSKIDILTTGSGKGTFKKDAGFFQRAGVSLGLGWESFKFYVEGGYEGHNIDGMSFEGTLTNNISKVDLSGTYTMVGVIINDLPDWIKPGKLFTVGGQ